MGGKCDRSVRPKDRDPGPTHGTRRRDTGTPGVKGVESTPLLHPSRLPEMGKPRFHRKQTLIPTPYPGLRDLCPTSRDLHPSGTPPLRDRSEESDTSTDPVPVPTPGGLPPHSSTVPLPWANLRRPTGPYGHPGRHPSPDTGVLPPLQKVPH